MIEQIRGVLLKKIPTFCVVNCQGIGIGLFISLNTFRYLGQQSEEIELLTHLHVREDALQLYGFAVEEERDLFRKLINISGIGPRLAMTMLSGLPVEEFKRALASEDVDLLTKVPGVGKKTAQRVILELKEKIDLSGEVVLTELPALTATEREKIEEALRALVTLGYKQYQAKASLEKVIKKHGRELSLEDTIKLALQEM
ncbi:MAG: Holliday junction branch migration protein RuvA [Calditrichia bacterium]|nr:Holliday junction branch migration protein RuvA [Calditrichia bacterium]MCK5454028.1 Holliday junction branch migration protein RuvA [Calditrichia bacterium]